MERIAVRFIVWERGMIANIREFEYKRTKRNQMNAVFSKHFHELAMWCSEYPDRKMEVQIIKREIG